MTDFLSVLPVFIRDSDSAPVRDAVAAAVQVMFTEYDGLSAYAAAQSDVLSSTGPYLDMKLGERGYKRHTGEGDEDFRARGIGFTDCVTPAAVVAAVNAIIAPLTCSYMEPALDRLFISAGTGTWHSFIGAEPSYADRYYPDDATANGGVVRPSIDPGKGRIFSTSTGRYFALRIPDLSALDTSIQYTSDGTTGSGLFIYDGTTSSTYKQYIYGNTTDSQTTYDLIVATVDRLKGASFRWALVVQT